MKNLLIQLTHILIGLSIIGFAVKIFPTEIFETKTSVISIMNDITEKHSSQIEPQNIIPQLKLKENKFEGYTFRFVDLSDVSLNPVVQFTLETAPRILSNEIKRDSEIKQFEDSIIKELTPSQIDTSGRSHSSIYIPIAKELTVLRESDADSKILVVYSDLMENTPQLSLYDKRTYFNSTEIKKLFKESFPLPNLKGIEVYLIYQPSTPNTDNTYTIISQVYKELFSEKGASVYIQANFLKTQ